MWLRFRETPLVWRELVWSRPLDAADAIARLRSLADDPTMPNITVEIRGLGGRIRYLLGVRSSQMGRVLRLLDVPGLPVDIRRVRPPMTTVRRLRVSTKGRMLDVTSPVESARRILQAMSLANNHGEELVVQLMLGPRLKAIPSEDDTAVVFSWRGLRFVDRPLDAVDRKSRAAKTGLPGFHCMIRVGVKAGSAARRQQLALGLLGGLKRLETPGLHMDYLSDRPECLSGGATVLVPRNWPLGLNVAEVASLLALPVGDESYPGLPPLHPKQLPAPANSVQVDADHVLIGLSTAAASLDQPLVRTTDALLHHLHVIGPTGTGKSVTLLNLALQDIQAGRGVVMIEPKGDLVEDILARLPAGRERDLVVFDPLDPDGVIGLNPLSGTGSAELKADAVYGIFADLFGDSLGVRTADLLRCGLLSLAHQPDASLVQLPLLFSDARLRRKLTAPLADDLALGPFWAWYNALRDSERSVIVAPLMNKLRALILNPAVRRVIGQVKPRFTISQVFREHRILLAPLPVNRLGAAGAGLLGSLLISQLWAAARERANVPVAARQPVAVYVDEAQQFLHLGTDLSDVLAMSRSYGVGWTLAHQYLGQLPPELRSAIMANCRSRLAFQPSRDDADTLAKTSSGLLEAQDFTSLSAHHVYMSLFANAQNQPYMSGRTLRPSRATNDPVRLRQRSALNYGRSISDIEAEFASWRTALATADGVAAEPIGRRKRGGHA